MTKHIFKGKWISDGRFASREPRQVFHRQLEKLDLPQDELANSHILFRKRFVLEQAAGSAKVFITQQQQQQTQKLRWLGKMLVAVHLVAKTPLR